MRLSLLLLLLTECCRGVTGSCWPACLLLSSSAVWARWWEGDDRLDAVNAEAVCAVGVVSERCVGKGRAEDDTLRLECTLGELGLVAVYASGKVEVEVSDKESVREVDRESQEEAEEAGGAGTDGAECEHEADVEG